MPLATTVITSVITAVKLALGVRKTLHKGVGGLLQHRDQALVIARTHVHSMCVHDPSD